MKIVLIVIGILMIIATLLPLLRKEAWWIRVFDFPRLQIAIISAVTLSAYLFLLREVTLIEVVFSAALGLCLLYQGYMMFPYTPLSSRQVQSSKSPRKETSFSLLFANVLMENRQADRLKEIIIKAEPDILLAVEINEWWNDQLKEFAQAYPFNLQQPQDNYYGMVLYSKLELVNPQVKFLVEDDIPSMHALVKLPSGQEVALHCVHPRPPTPTEEGRSTERDAELLIVGREIKRKNIPAVVMGDLNDVAWSHTTSLFQKISELLDPRIGRGFYHSFHARYPLMRFPLDHIFISNHFRLIDFKRLQYFGSDHFPVFAALSYEPDAAGQQQVEQADLADQEEAQEKIERVNCEIEAIEIAPEGLKPAICLRGCGKNYNEAIQLASKWPSLRISSLEVRPIDELIQT